MLTTVDKGLIHLFADPVPTGSTAPTVGSMAGDQGGTPCSEDMMVRITARSHASDEDLLDMVGQDAVLETSDPEEGAEDDEASSHNAASEEFEPDFYPEESDTIAKCSEHDGEGLQYDPSQDLPNPGEVGEEERGGDSIGVTGGTETVTQLDFSTKTTSAIGEAPGAQVGVCKTGNALVESKYIVLPLHTNYLHTTLFRNTKY